MGWMLLKYLSGGGCARRAASGRARVVDELEGQLRVVHVVLNLSVVWSGDGCGTLVLHAVVMMLLHVVLELLEAVDVLVRMLHLE
eukprot:2411113-Amphidinium_carterae.1